MSILTLAIETSNPGSASGDDEPGVALGWTGDGEPARVTLSEALRPASRHDDDLMGAIDRLMNAAGKRPEEIGRIAISVGPGGYTALRIAVATVKMIAEVTGAEAVAVPTAAVAAELVEVSQEGGFAVALASKAETAFITRFGANRRALGPGEVVNVDRFEELIGGMKPPGTLICDQFLPRTFAASAAWIGMQIGPLRLNAAGCLKAASGREPIALGALVPLYAREPEAVTLWRTRKS